MKNVFHVFFNDQTSLQIEGVVKKTSDTFLKVHELQDEALPLLLEIDPNNARKYNELLKSWLVSFSFVWKPFLINAYLT